MIPARKTPLFNRWFARHARARIEQSFSAVYVKGLREVRAASAEAPLLLLANHTAWWDPLVAIHLSNHVLGLDAFAMMDAKNLERLPFFAKVGAFGVVDDEPDFGREGLTALGTDEGRTFGERMGHDASS